MGIWNVLYTVYDGLEQVIKIGAASVEKSQSGLAKEREPCVEIKEEFPTNSVPPVTSWTPNNVETKKERALKRHLSSTEQVTPAVKRKRNNWKHSIESVHFTEPAKLTFLETVRRKRAFKLYFDSKQNWSKEEHAGDLNDSIFKTVNNKKVSREANNENRYTTEASNTENTENWLQDSRHSYSATLRRDIDMLKEKIRQLQRRERERIGLSVSLSDTSDLLKQKMLYSSQTLLSKAVFHQEESDRQSNRSLCEKGLLELRSKSYIHRSRALFYAEQVRKTLQSLEIEEHKASKDTNRESTKPSRADRKEDEIIVLSESDDDFEQNSEKEESNSENSLESLPDREAAVSINKYQKYLKEGRFPFCIAEEENDPLSSLLPDACGYCDFVLESKRRYVVVSPTGWRISREDLCLLFPGKWLNDEIINFYMFLLQERNERLWKKFSHPKCYFFSSFFFSKLMFRGAYDFFAVRKWTRKLNLFEFDKIIIPINVAQVHWIVAVINIKSKCFETYDSIGDSHLEKLKLLQRWLEDTSEDKLGYRLDTSSWPLVKPVVPHQQNTDDCGVYCCQFAHYISSNWEINFSSENIPYFRKRMMLEILSQHVG
eukprot:jgi/Galph1/2582/GphlegSOOS_G1256.1